MNGQNVMEKDERKDLLKKFCYIQHQAECKLFDYRLELAEKLLSEYEDLIELEADNKCPNNPEDYCYEDMRGYLEIVRDYLEIMVELKDDFAELENCINTNEF